MDKKTILHTENSMGLGGQELRILREAVGMKERGHHVLFAVKKAAKIASKAVEAGFEVTELDFEKRLAFRDFLKLKKLKNMNSTF